MYHLRGSRCEAPTYPSSNVAKGQIMKWDSAISGRSISPTQAFCIFFKKKYQLLSIKESEKVQFEVRKLWIKCSVMFPRCRLSGRVLLGEEQCATEENVRTWKVREIPEWLEGGDFAMSMVGLPWHILSGHFVFWLGYILRICQLITVVYASNCL